MKKKNIKYDQLTNAHKLECISDNFTQVSKSSNELEQLKHSLLKVNPICIRDLFTLEASSNQIQSETKQD